MILTVYAEEPPPFPASDQRPDALRYGPFSIDDQIVYVDAVGGEPTASEIAAMLAPPVVAVISDRQFFQGLATIGEITPAEAEEAVGPGTIPAAMAALIDQLPEAERFAARMKIRGATQFDRYDPLTETFCQLYGWTPEQLDQFWAMCAGL